MDFLDENDDIDNPNGQSDSELYSAHEVFGERCWAIEIYAQAGRMMKRRATAGTSTQ